MMLPSRFVVGCSPTRRLRRRGLSFVLAVAVVSLPQGLLADAHPGGVPVFNSDPGAAYTIYLDFAGFNFTGGWGGEGGATPGATSSFDGTTSDFTDAQRSTILRFAGYVADAYAPFNINVTTVDPAIAAGKANTDADRQAYYDSHAQLLHTVVTSSYQWWGSPGGVSYVNTASNSYDPSTINGGAGAGLHTNWLLAGTGGMAYDAGRTAAHEDGHMLGLWHQSDYAPGATPKEYTGGDMSTSPGTYGAIMGYNGFDQRSTWRLGNAGSSAAIQNDMAVLAANPGMGGYRDGGVGHSLTGASRLPLSGSEVDPALARGIITPNSVSAPTPIGIDNYTRDYWAFTSDGVNGITLTAWNGDELLVVGVQDGGPTLRSKLNILDSGGSLYASAIEDSSTLFETFTGILPAGRYYAEITSFGGHTQLLPNDIGGFYDTTYYYDAGAYFLTGSGFAVPEPSTLMAIPFLAYLTVFRRNART